MLSELGKTKPAKLTHAVMSTSKQKQTQIHLYITVQLKFCFDHGLILPAPGGGLESFAFDSHVLLEEII